jgi:ATP-binding cassette, subfamily C, bacterial CydCD
VKPVDPRLLRHARATRIFLLASVVLGLAGAGLVVAQAVLLAEVIVQAFQQGALARTALALLAATALGRALVSWLTELAAHRAGAAVKSELRLRLLTHATALGPDHAPRTGELTALATRGVDALDDYFARYLPQLALAVVVPTAVLARIVVSDWISALTIAVTLPLIPVFMVLIGWATQARMDRQWALLSRLSHHFLDVVAGLPTLKVFGRAKAQADNIRALTADYRRATLRTLRLAFLSSFALELLATLSVALVAVGVGMRLVHGELDLYTGLVVLILAPEAYLPLRQVGAQYHAAAEGLSAADQVFRTLGTPLPEAGDRPAPASPAVTLEEVCVRHQGRSGDSLPPTSLTLRPGETVALTGPSGAGKSTLLHAVLGLTRPTTGRVLLDDDDLADVEPGSWHRQVAWVPQQPHLFAGTLADNVRLPRPSATDAEVHAALDAAHAGDLDPGSVLGEQGAGLSAGQRQRVALARAFLADRPVLLLDEPTAALDVGTEDAVVDAIGRLARGRTTLLVAHRPALLRLADRAVSLPAPAAPGVRAAEEHPHWTGAVAHGDTPEAAGPRTGEPETEEPETEEWGPGLSGKDDGRPLARVRRAARPLRSRFALALLLGTLALGSAVGLMATSGWLISRASQQPPVLYLMVAVTATRAFGIGRAFFRYAERLVSHDAVLRLLAGLRVAVYTRLERLAPAGLRQTRRGDLLSRLVSDVDALQDHFLRWLLPAATAVTVSLGAAGFTAALLPEAGAALAAGLAVAGIAVPLLTAALSRRTEHRLAPARGTLAVRTVDLLGGTGELTVAGALPARTEAVREADADLTRLAGRSAARTGIGAGLTALTTGLTVAAAAWAGAVAVTAGRLDGVLLAVVALTALAAFEAVAGMPLAVQYRRRTQRAAERVQEVLDAPLPVREHPGADVAAVDAVTRRWRQAGSLPGPAPSRLSRGQHPASPYPGSASAAGEGRGGAGETRTSGEGSAPRLTLRGVTARHPGQKHPALADVDLELTPGRRIAVVGPSGSGKTTLAQVLLRFLDPESGTYTLTTVDATVDATAGDADAVRGLVGLCAQDAHFFDSTLRENLRLALPPGARRRGERETDALIHRALAAARLDDWAGALPAGLDTPVGEHGARLSGGQRRRLALARALLAGFPVLVLDEPAEHLDLPTADALTADLLAVTENRTTVLITHRLHGLEAVDEVIVLDAGRVAERGGHAELARRPHGLFRAMLDREAATQELRARACCESSVVRP